MSNETFDDIAVLKTLAQLKRKDLLLPSDQELLLERLQSEWGRSAAQKLLSNNPVDEDSLSILRKFSSAF